MDMKSIDAFFHVLEKTPFSRAIVVYPWIWPTCETLHFIGLALLIGCIGVLDLRMLGYAKHISIAAIHRFVPWGIAGFMINLITGLLFFIGAPFQYLHNLAFQWKLVFLAIAGLNVMYFYLGGVLHKVEALGPDADPPTSAKVVSAISIFSWFAVMYWGRMLPFVGNAF
jgi:hypothetical protein